MTGDLKFEAERAENGACTNEPGGTKHPRQRRAGATGDGGLMWPG